MKCRICDGELTGQQTAFCSNECRDKNYKVKAAAIYRQKLTKKICALDICDKEFMGKSSKSYCSKECSSESHRRARERTRINHLARNKKEFKVKKTYNNNLYMGHLNQ